MARTFSAGCTKNWVAIVDGAQYSSFGIQLASQTMVFVATHTSVPDASFTDYLKMQLSFTRELAFDLETNEKLYIKADVNLAEAVSGFRKLRVPA